MATIDGAVMAAKSAELQKFVASVGLIEIDRVVPNLGLGFAEAAEEPGIGDDRIEEVTLFGTDGLVTLVVEAGELREGGGIFAADDLQLGIDAGFEAVHARNSLARG